MMSHDWPNGVVEYGDKADLLSKKKHFAGIAFSVLCVIHGLLGFNS